MALNGNVADGVQQEMPEEVREAMVRIGPEACLVLNYDVTAGLDTLSRSLHTPRSDPLRMSIRNIVAREFKCDLSTLSAAITKCPNTNVLWLERSEFRPEAFGELEATLMESTNLEALCLKRQSLSDSGAKVVANVLTKWKNKSLKTLYLGYCSIGHEGAQAISSSLLR
jgi:Ran GTPase-activating protein (RanGAP) involved in mRNA processing and transport